MTMQTVKIYSFNVRGLGGTAKRIAIFSWLKKYHNGIHFLQETHSSVNTEEKWIKEWGSNVKFCHGSTNSRGVAILCNKNIDLNIEETIKDNTGRMILINCKIYEKSFTLVNIYCPTKDNESLQLKFLTFIEDTIEKYGHENIILGGDVNTYLDVIKDKKGGLYEKESNYAKKMKFMLDLYNIVDIWRVRNPNIERSLEEKIVELA